MFKLNMGETTAKISDDEYRYLGANTEGYSGADISLVVRDALMQPVRRVQTATHFKQVKKILFLTVRVVSNGPNSLKVVLVVGDVPTFLKF